MTRAFPGNGRIGKGNELPDPIELFLVGITILAQFPDRNSFFLRPAPRQNSRTHGTSHSKVFHTVCTGQDVGCTLPGPSSDPVRSLQSSFAPSPEDSHLADRSGDISSNIAVCFPPTVLPLLVFSLDSRVCSPPLGRFGIPFIISTVSAKDKTKKNRNLEQLSVGIWDSLW